MNEPTTDYLELQRLAVDAAQVAGNILTEMQGTIKAVEKAPKDLVTEADVASQTEIFERIGAARGEDWFLGEEHLARDGFWSDRIVDSSADLSELEYCWVVDPLDGTINYVHQLPGYCVSIAVLRYGQPVAAAVFDPVLGECYSAASGMGAFCNGQPLSTSRCEQISESLVAASFSAGVTRGSLEVERWVEMLYQCQSLRRMGSAALNLCYVAQGGLDAYWATSVKIWDIAAGILIVREAGGTVTALDSSELDLGKPQFIAAGNGNLHNQIVSVFKQL